MRASRSTFRWLSCAVVATFGWPDRAPAEEAIPPLVFAARDLGDTGWGLGPAHRARPDATGRLQVREPDGTLRTLVDGWGERPLGLVDVDAPAVSYDGESIVFAGRAASTGDSARDGWRLYRIQSDGSDLRPLTVDAPRTFDAARFGARAEALRHYDDFDPAWLPDGRIVFSSTRYPGFAQSTGVRTSNLFIVRPDGTDVHRITSERHGADRPTIDPTTGRILYARWWRNEWRPTAALKEDDGLTSQDQLESLAVGRNAWQLASIATDGRGLQRHGGWMRSEDASFGYGGSVLDDGTLIATAHADPSLTDGAGYHGLRSHQASGGVPAMLTGTEQGGEPCVLPSGGVVFAKPGPQGDLGLWLRAADGTVQPLVDQEGLHETRAAAVTSRTVPPRMDDLYRDDDTMPRPSMVPPKAEGPWDDDGTFVFEPFNVYANAPVDVPIVSAPPVGSVRSIRFYVDAADGQRPALVSERSVNSNGWSILPNAPANLPLFEQLRSSRPDAAMPATGGPWPDGAAHVAGHNFSAMGERVTCMGCHAGHSVIEVPESFAEARFSNLAPGAVVTTSSARTPDSKAGLIDRKVRLGSLDESWTSELGKQDGEWAQLLFPVSIGVRTVRLYAPRQEAESTLQVLQAKVTLFGDEGMTRQTGQQTVWLVEPNGTDVDFGQSRARVVRVDLINVEGTFRGQPAASLGEIEVIAAGLGRR